MQYEVNASGSNFTGRRIRQAREELGISQDELGKMYGSTGANISQIERGIRNPSFNSIKRFAAILNRPVEWFYRPDAKPYARPPESALSDIEVSLKAYIPVYAEVSAGPGMEPIDWVATTRERAAPDTLRAFRVRGLCLDPEVKEGDTLIVDTSLEPRDGDLVVCIIDGEASVKKYHKRQPDRVREGPSPPTDWLENNHGTYRPDEVYQVGVVVEYTRKRR